jgi:hypothetical protein
VFCNFCGAQQGVIPQAAGAPAAPGMPAPGTPAAQAYNPAAPVQQVAAAPMPQNLKCNSCGAPLKPSSGLALVVCAYCGAATTMGAGGAAQVIQKHFMLASSISQEQALTAGGQWLNKGILRRKVAETSDVGNTVLKFVPYWVVPTTIVADYQGTRGAGVAQMRSESTGGKILGGALFALQAAATANQNRNATPQVTRVRDRIQVSKNIPVVAVRGYNKYQPEGGYEFNEAAKIAFDKRQSGGADVMDGDVTEAEAKQLAGGQAQKIAEREAKKRVDTLESIQVYPTMTDGELLHVPVYFVEYTHKGKAMFIAIDGNAGHVMNGERPAISLW